MLKKMHNAKGFTLIELMIVIAIIGILAAIAIPMYRAQTCKAKLSEVTNAISHVASAISAYYNENGSFPADIADAAGINTTLGVGLPTGNGRISDCSWDSTNTRIDATIGAISGCPTEVQSHHLYLTASTQSNGAISWAWSASSGFPASYLPKK